MNQKNNYNINYSWTQPYLPTSYNPFYERAWVYENNSMLEAIEQKLASMDRFPEAEKLIQKAQGHG